MEKKWDDDLICAELLSIANGGAFMPSHKTMNDVTGSKALSVAVTKRGGSQRFAKMLGLKIKDSESKYGEEYEYLCIEHIEDRLGLLSEKMKIRYPYDVLCAGCVKIDVKVSNLERMNVPTKYYTFNLEKPAQTCDIFVFYCVKAKNDIQKILIIPSAVFYGMTQLSIGVIKSDYDKYIDQWHYISDYAKFMKGGII